MSLACILVTIVVVVVLVATNISPSQPTLPVRREWRLGVEGGVTTVGGGSEGKTTFLTNGGFVVTSHATLRLCFPVASFSF